MIRLHMTRALFTAGVMLSAGVAHAQQDPNVRIDEHWRAYIGCWASSTAGRPGPMVCVVPTSAASTVDFVTVVRDSIVSTIPLSVTGGRIGRTRDGCTGWESARWSLDERRLYTTSEFTCADGVKQSASGLISMRQTDAFSRIDGIRTRGSVRTRVVQFQLTTDSTLYPAAIASRMPSASSMQSFAAQMEASAEVSTADVVDASKALDSPVVEAWIADLGQKFAVSAKDLRAMKASGVSDGVIDMVVAVSNPDYFTLAQNGAPVARPNDPFQQRRGGYADNSARAELERLRRAQQLGIYGNGYGSLYDWTDMYFPLAGYGGFGYSSYGRGALYGGYAQYWGPFGPYYGSGGGWITGGKPYVIVPGTPPEPPGRVINGSGYSQGGASTSRGAEPRSPNVESSRGSSSGGGGGGGGGATATPAPPPAPAPAPSSPAGEQRTAKPRP
jgi:hypothetical protein